MAHDHRAQEDEGRRSLRSFGCTAHYSRGSAICPNALSISEKKASRTLVHALKEKLDRPDLFDRFVSTFKQRVATLRGESHGDADNADRRVRECERRIANLTEALAKVGWSESLGNKLREEEVLLVRLKAERTTAAKDPALRVVPHPKAIEAYFRNLFTLLDTDPARGREILSRFVAPIVMTPEIEGPARRYRATGAFNLGFFLNAISTAETRTGKSGCAGRI